MSCDLLGVRTLPFTARRNYYYEFKHLMFWGVLAGVVEGQFASVVVSKTFHASERLIAIATATPIAAHLFSLPWGMLSVGRRKVRIVVLLACGVTLCVGTVTAAPVSPAGAIWFIAQMAVAQVLLTGVLTVRSAFWKSNYPRNVRGQVTARLQTVRFVVSVSAVLAASAVCDIYPNAYHYVFPAAAVAGVIAITILPKLHIRGERSELSRGRRASADNCHLPSAVEPFSMAGLLWPGRVLGQMYRVLRDDRRFAYYCTAQLFSGLGNLLTISIIVAVVTRDLDVGETWAFWISTALIVALPRIVMLGTFRRWGQLFDRLGVIRFRLVNVCCWTLTLVLGLGATLATVKLAPLRPAYLVLAVGLFCLRAITYGLSVGGGALAWNLGHLHFARPEKAEIYMG
ncbi:MAG: hypothetical protein ACE5HE_14975, partial [Phycisphaerae bacterium]